LEETNEKVIIRSNKFLVDMFKKWFCACDHSEPAAQLS